MATPTVFVTGATGTVGGALARQLRALGWGVHTTTRSPDAPAARALAALGVHVTEASWDDEPALARALAGCSKLFVNLFPDPADVTHELRQAQLLFRLAREAGATQVVYSSLYPVEGLDPAMPAAQIVRLKVDIEQAAAAAGFDHWTVLRPGFFMPNFLVPKLRAWPGAADTGVFTLALLPDTPLPLTDDHDIARFAVAAFREPERFAGRVLTLASEVLPVQEALRQLGEAAGRKGFRGRFLTDQEIEEAKTTNFQVGIEVACRGMAEQVDMEQLRTWGVPLTPFRAFLEREKAAVLESYKNVKE